MLVNTVLHIHVLIKSFMLHVDFFGVLKRNNIEIYQVNKYKDFNSVNTMLKGVFL